MKRRLAALFTAIVFCFSILATNAAAAEVNSGSEPNISVIMSHTTDGATDATIILVTNNGTAPIRFYAKEGKWIDADYSGFDREIDLYDFTAYDDDESLADLPKVDYVDIQAGDMNYLLVGVKSNDTYYDKNTTIKLYTYYDGAHYETSSSESGGFRYSLMEGSDPALAGHIASAEVKENVKPATCTAEGSYDAVIYCDFCGDEASRVTNVVPVIPHKEVTDAAVAPSCTVDGLTEGKHCSACGLVITAQEVVPATGHTEFTDPETSPTCTEDGMTEGTRCTVCNEVLLPPTLIPATGHNLVNGECTVCGYVAAAVDAPVIKSSNVASSGKIKLTWNAVEGAVEYKVFRSASKEGKYTLMKTVKNGSTSYTNTNATAGKYYYYYVVAVSADGIVSEKSNIAGRTCDYAQPVVTASNVASSGKIKLTWKAVEGATSYKVYRSTSKNGTYSLMKTATGTTYTNTSAKAGTMYYYKVKAVGPVSAATSAESAVKSRTCDYARPAVTASNVASTGKIKLTWKAVEGATSYKVYRSTSKDGEYTLMKTVKDGSVTYTNTSAKAGTMYYYKVKAVGSVSAAASAYSVVDSRTCDLPRPVVKITTSSGKPKLSWAAVTGATKYKIYRATSKNGTYTSVKTTTSKSWKDTTAKKGKTYYYKVVAVHSKSAANSAYSAIKSIKCTK